MQWKASFCYGSSFLWLLVAAAPGFGQSLGNAGTVEGTAVDPSGAAIPKASITLHNPVSGYNQAVTSDTNGAFRVTNIPRNTYHLEVSAPGFAAFSQDVEIRNSVPVRVQATLALAGAQTSVTVEAAGADILENDPSAHVDTNPARVMFFTSTCLRRATGSRFRMITIN